MPDPELVITTTRRYAIRDDHDSTSSQGSIDAAIDEWVNASILRLLVVHDSYVRDVCERAAKTHNPAFHILVNLPITLLEQVTHIRDMARHIRDTADSYVNDK